MASQPTDFAISSALMKPRLPIIGNLKIGLKAANRSTGSQGGEFQRPMKIDHFIVTTLERDAHGNFIRDEAVHAKVGEKPTELDIWLPFEKPEENFYAQMVQYGGPTRTFQCNGQRGTNLSTGVSAPCSKLLGKKCGCKPYGRLAVFLGSAPTFGGLHVFRTTAWGTVGPLQTAIKLFYEQFGSLWGLPLRMKLYPATVKFGEQKEKKTTAYWVALVLRASLEEAQRAALEVRRSSELMRRDAVRLLPGTQAALAESDREEAPHIRGEFFPDAPGEGPSSLDKLSQINEEIASDAQTREDVPVAEVVESSPVASTSPPTAPPELVQELERLIEAVGTLHIPPALKKLQEAVATRADAAVRSSVQWIKDKAAGNDEMQLRIRRSEARFLLAITAEEEQAIEDTLVGGDKATIRMWAQVLTDRIQKPDAPAQGSLL